MNHSFEGILWDLDGVLVDTGDFHFRSWEETLTAYGIPFSLELFQQTFGMNNLGVISVLMGAPAPVELAAEIGGRKEDAFRAAIHGRAYPMPGVLDLLTHFQQKGIPQAVASSAPQVSVDILIDELGIRPFFKSLVSGALLAGKPDPATFLLAAHQLGVSPQNCLVFEDAVVGVEAAHRAGMKCIAVTTTNPAEKLLAADLVVDSLSNLPADFEDLVLSGQR